MAGGQIRAIRRLKRYGVDHSDYNIGKPGTSGSGRNYL